MPGRLLVLIAALCLLLAAPARGVVGGVPATEAYPWMASLQHGQSHFCGGALIAPDTVLTAAHCVDGEQPQQLSVVLGRAKLSAAGGERIRAKSLEADARFRTDPDGGHDIALVRLQRPSDAPTLDVVSPPQDGLWAPGSPVRVVGWGSSVFAVGPGSDDLMQADIEVISDADCDASYNGLVNYGFDPRTMLCAGQRVIGLEDACQGDSGGPLLARAGAGWVAVGTVSNGLGCGFPLFYGVYSRLGAPALRGWLDERLNAQGAVKDLPPAEPSDVRLRVERVRPARRKLVLRVTATAPVTAVKATLLRRGRVVGRGGLPRIRARGRIVVATKRRAPRRVTLRITATDPAGRAVRLRRPVSLRR